MGVLTEIQDNRIVTDRGKIIVNPAFDIVLEIQRLYLEDSLTDYEKVEQALKMLVRNRWNLRLYPPAEKVKLLKEIGKRYIDTKKRPKIKQNPLPVLDFEEDGDYIYASFMHFIRLPSL